ncbi:protein NRT1/ PTR FAMILY 5.10-like isoform X2 [Typha angustifolia]|uniref:protein NRT1/ PTR FAMILY 5.10-like isoform X2 n=1 Tax=Typha angustifolia TaxID=59011 RepID=UPI003C2D07D8
MSTRRRQPAQLCSIIFIFGGNLPPRSPQDFTLLWNPFSDPLTFAVQLVTLVVFVELFDNEQTQLILLRSDPLEGVVDYRGRPVSRSGSGRLTSALFIIGVEIAERFVFYGICSNLITYLTGPLRESTAAAAAGVNAWFGVASMLPLFGAFLADSCLGRYRTIVLASILYLLGLSMLSFSATLPSLQPPKCRDINDTAACKPSTFQVAFFYFSLYLVAFAQGGHKPCVQAFGADQFDQNDPKERAARSSFFNWWYFGMCGGNVLTIPVLNYIQDNLGWGFGFGVPCIAMLLALILFLLGTKTYRFYLLDHEDPFTRLGKSFVTLVRRSRETQGSKEEYEDDVDHAEEAKGILKLFPIWATCLVYGVAFAQSVTFFTKQASTLDRNIVSGLQVPSAALQSFITLSVVAFVPIYDRLIVPVARKFSLISSGITMLQRIGTGMFVSIVSMVIAALVEMKRLKTARDYGLVDQPGTPIPMSFWWIVPQFLLVGIADVFTMVGLQEFFYDQMPDALRSLGLALYLSIFGVGSFISSFLVSVVDETTKKGQGISWFSDNLNRGHLDYFYWLLGGLSALELAIYLFFTKDYVYKAKGNITVN